jgi:hypothetical protein
MRPNRAHVAYLVVLLAMMSCLAVITTHPIALSTRPDHWVVAVVLAAGAVAIALRRPFSYPVGLGAAFFAILAGVVSLRAPFGIRLPGMPWVWILGGLYVAFRLALNQQAVTEKGARRRGPGGLPLPETEQEDDEPRKKEGGEAPAP